MDRVRQVLHALFEKRATNDDAMRAILEYPEWQIPIELYAGSSPGDAPIVAPRVVMVGERLVADPGVFYMFSDDETARRAATHLGSVAAGIPGLDALRRALAIGTRLVVNPGSPDADTFGLPLDEHSKGLMSLWVHAVELEQLVAKGPLTDPAVLRALRDYHGFVTYFHTATKSVVTIPDQLGLKNGAVLFTTPDNVKAFLDKLPAEVQEGLTRVPTDGDTWFTLVVKGGGVDGVILNPLGPAEAVAIPLAVCEQVSELEDSPE